MRMLGILLNKFWSFLFEIKKNNLKWVFFYTFSKYKNAVSVLISIL